MLALAGLDEMMKAEGIVALSRSETLTGLRQQAATAPSQSVHSVRVIWCQVDVKRLLPLRDLGYRYELCQKLLKVPQRPLCRPVHW